MPDTGVHYITAHVLISQVSAENKDGDHLIDVNFV